MARYVKVSIVSPRALSLDESWDSEEQVQHMMRYWGHYIDQVLPLQPDIILLPEACDRFGGSWFHDEHPYTTARMRAYYDVRGTRMRDFLAEIAKKHHCYIGYSAARQLPDGTFRNSTQLIGRDGQVEGIYNKNHLVYCEGVLDGPLPMMCGKDAPVFDLDFGKTACAICFDLNFDELRHRYMQNRPELLLFSSMYHGGFMQQAWAYDLRSWFASAISGQESRIISPVGEVMAASTNYFPYVSATINLDYAVCHLDDNWDRFTAAIAKYGDRICMRDPGKIGAVLLTSETDAFTVQDLIREFHIETIDDYFNRSRRSQQARIEA